MNSPDKMLFNFMIGAFLSFMIVPIVLAAMIILTFVTAVQAGVCSPVKGLVFIIICVLFEWVAYGAVIHGCGLALDASFEYAKDLYKISDTMDLLDDIYLMKKETGVDACDYFDDPHEKSSYLHMILLYNDPCFKLCHDNIFRDIGKVSLAKLILEPSAVIRMSVPLNEFTKMANEGYELVNNLHKRMKGIDEDD